jgi:hypothetical protein
VYCCSTFFNWLHWNQMFVKEIEREHHAYIQKYIMLSLHTFSNCSIKFGTLTLMATLESLIKVSITAFCSSCENRLLSGRCDFVGCHVGTRLTPKYEARCLAMIEDETATAMLFVQGTSGSTRSNGRPLRSLWGRVFNFKLDCFAL